MAGCVARRDVAVFSGSINRGQGKTVCQYFSLIAFRKLHPPEVWQVFFSMRLVSFLLSSGGMQS